MDKTHLFLGLSHDWWLVLLTWALVLGTFALAIYTARLWRSTKTSADRQSTEMQSALAIARSSADAAKTSAEATARMVELGQKQFIASHRPMLVVRMFERISLEDGNEAIMYQIHNVGDSDAHVLEISERAPCRPWNSPADFGSQVSRSLIKLIKTTPSVCE